MVFTVHYSMMARRGALPPNGIQSSLRAAVSILPSPKLQPTTGGRKCKAILKNRGTRRATSLGHPF